MNNNIKVVAISLVICVISITSYHFIFNKTNKEEIGYVSVAELYDSHPLKSQYSIQLDKLERDGGKKLDSLSERISDLAKMISTKPGDVTLLENFNRLKEDYGIIENRIRSNYQESMDKYRAEIMSKVNEAVEEYGKANNFKVIIGATGDGALMHGDESIDLTEKIKKKFND